MRYYTIDSRDNSDSILKQLDEDYGLSNMYALGKPQSLGGKAKVLTIRIPKKDDHVKIDGPGFIVEEIFNKLLSRERYG